MADYNNEPFVTEFDLKSTPMVQMCEPLKQNLHFSLSPCRNFTVSIFIESLVRPVTDTPPIYTLNGSGHAMSARTLMSKL